MKNKIFQLNGFSQINNNNNNDSGNDDKYLFKRSTWWLFSVELPYDENLNKKNAA